MKQLFLFLAIIMTVFTMGCMEEPDLVGGPLLPKKDIVNAQVDTLPASGSSSRRVFQQYLGSTQLLIGKSGETESWAWIKFLQIPDTLTDVTVEQADVELSGNYVYGSGTTLTFDVHKGLKNWHTEESTFNDSLKLEAIEIGTYYDAATIGSFPGFPSTDSTISFQIDTSLVREWLQSNRDSTNFGMVLKPTNNNLIRGFKSFLDAGVRPTLRVLYQKPGSTQIDTTRFSAGIDRFLANVPTNGWSTDNTTMYVRNGIAYRPMIDFQSVSIPRNRVVHSAILEVTSLSTFDPSLNDSFYVAFVQDTSITGFRITGTKIKNELSNNNVYWFQIREFLRFWKEGIGSKTVSLGSYFEASTIDVFELHGPASPHESFRPRLIITYSEF